MPDGATIQRMFAEVAPGYDRANHTLSLGVDTWWRRQTVATVGAAAGEKGLDVCSGTGDLSLALRRAGALVIGADFCPPMLVRANAKASSAAAPVRFLAADALALPFGDATFDFATVASHGQGAAGASLVIPCVPPCRSTSAIPSCSASLTRA
jgi:demethylmenaquinone methyltransferase/2-methoxy-6-polyprenyl-1,4-benzoquinol methylase